MINKIKHLGIVENIDGSHLKVRIVQTSACSACAVKGHCSAAESKEKLIDAYAAEGTEGRIGGQVLVVGTASMGKQAVLLAFVLPFLLVVATLFISMACTGGNELLSAASGLAVLLPFYLILYVCRHRLGRVFTFTVESIN